MTRFPGAPRGSNVNEDGWLIVGDGDNLIDLRRAERDRARMNDEWITRDANLPARFWSKVDASGDCWGWTGSFSGTDGGYGQIESGGRSNRRALRAHRVAWTLLVGPIPAGLELDHLCRNRGCVNPDHLEPVTPAENRRRANSHTRRPNRERRECYAGHPYTVENTRYIEGGRERRCRACDAIRQRRYTARKRAA